MRGGCISKRTDAFEANAPRAIVHDNQIQEVGRHLLGLADQGCTKLVLSFAGVEAMASLVVGKLLVLNNRLRAAGGRLVMCDVEPALFEVFEILKLPKLIGVYADAEVEGRRGHGGKLLWPGRAGGGMGRVGRINHRGTEAQSGQQINFLVFSVPLCLCG